MLAPSYNASPLFARLCRCTLFNKDSTNNNGQFDVCLKRDEIEKDQTITLDNIACGATLGVFCHGAPFHHQRVLNNQVSSQQVSRVITSRRAGAECTMPCALGLAHAWTRQRALPRGCVFRRVTICAIRSVTICAVLLDSPACTGTHANVCEQCQQTRFLPRSCYIALQASPLTLAVRCADGRYPNIAGPSPSVDQSQLRTGCTSNDGGRTCDIGDFVLDCGCPA